MNIVNENSFKFCIYNYNDYSTSTFLSCIKQSIIQKDKYTLKCTDPPNTQWKKYGSFFGINPSITPMSVNLNIFAITHKDSFPYNAIAIELIIDKFNQAYTKKVQIYNNNIQYNDNESITYFAAWSMPLPNTIPLYFIQESNGIYFSFNNINNNSNNTIIGNVISPIFVLSDNIFNNLSDIKFKCVDGNIIPSKDDNIPNDIFSYNKIGKSLPISQQISMCNQSIKKGKPLSIDETIRQISSDKKKLNYKFI